MHSAHFFITAFSSTFFPPPAAVLGATAPSLTSGTTLIALGTGLGHMRLADFSVILGDLFQSGLEEALVRVVLLCDISCF